MDNTELETAVDSTMEDLPLKPIHILVMILTLLHALAIGVWAFMFVSSKRKSTPVTQIHGCSLLHFFVNYRSKPNLLSASLSIK